MTGKQLECQLVRLGAALLMDSDARSLRNRHSLPEREICLAESDEWRHELPRIGFIVAESVHPQILIEGEERRLVVGNDEPVPTADHELGIDDVADELQHGPFIRGGTIADAWACFRDEPENPGGRLALHHGGIAIAEQAQQDRPVRRGLCDWVHDVCAHRCLLRPIASPGRVGATLPAPMASRVLSTPQPIDLGLSLAPLRHGPADPTMRIGREIWRTTRTPDGAATIRISPRGDAIEVEAWGPGTDNVLARAASLVGLDDDPSAFQPDHPLIRRLHAMRPGLRFARSGAVMESLVPAILEQKVTGVEASRAWREIVIRYGEAAPGPAGDAGLRVAPTPAALAALPYYAFHPLGVERRRADVIRRASAAAGPITEAALRGTDALSAQLTAMPGIGPWTAAEVAVRVLGDPDATSVGDFHLPNLVSWALAGEPRGTDERMLELLEPFRGQRARVIRLLALSGIRAPRYGPRMSIRSIASI